jgi:hypothetical protein
VTTVKYELGTLDEVDIEFYSVFVDDDNMRFITLIRQTELNATNRIYEYSESDFGPVNVGHLIGSDSVVVTLNNDRRIIYLRILSDDSIFNDDYYQKRGNTFTKTFTNEDYENADPI